VSSPAPKLKFHCYTGDGYVRSEGAIAVLLQKAKDAKRVYAKVLAAGSNCDGYKDEGITFPSCEMQVKLFKRVAEIAGIDPKTIDFMEAHGSATRVRRLYMCMYKLASMLPICVPILQQEIVRFNFLVGWRPARNERCCRSIH